MTMPLTEQLWASVEGIHHKILAHPFIDELTTGKLDRDVFRFYVIQDVHYIAQFARILATVAARAPERHDVALLMERSTDITLEHALHESLLADLGVDDQTLAGTPMAPANRAYTDYLHRVALTRPFSDALAALLACPWIYWEVGKELLEQGSPDPLYQRWIVRYGDEEASTTVRPYLELADRVGAGLGAAQRESAVEHFTIGCRYEWMFWDAAYRREQWPV